MNKIMYLLALSFVSYSCFSQSTIYSFQLDSINNNKTINFSAFQGKKIVIVNIATADSNTNQLAELEQFYQLYKDSVVIIAIPSNSFNTEPRTNSQIATFCTANYNIHFPLAAKVLVTGATAHNLYKWLTQKTLNTIINSTVNGSFQKYLINKQGKLAGVFGRKTKPMSQTFRHAIEVL